MTKFTEGRAASVKDVAAIAGVSTQTVSRVVNGSDKVLDKTRQKVLDAIKALGYRRNEVARNLIQGRTRTIGVIVEKTEAVDGRHVNTGITAAAETLGYSLLLKERGDQNDVASEAFIQNLAGRQLDGILWLLTDNTGKHAPILQKLVSEYAIPVVTLVASRSYGIPASEFDNFGAGVLATRHLIQRGKRVIAHIAGPEHSWDAQERKRGWKSALQEIGLTDSTMNCYHGNWLPEEGEAGLYALLQENPKIDAIFAANDHTALGAMLAAHRLGKAIPADIAFVGIDDCKGAGWFHPR